VLEHLPSALEVLGSILAPEKKKKKKIKLSPDLLEENALFTQLYTCATRLKCLLCDNTGINIERGRI
jgi:hypothetical protein